MKIKQYGLQIEELKASGKSNREIAVQLGLTYEQVKGYFRRARREQRLRGYPRSKKDDALKTKQELRREVKSLRMEVDLLRGFMAAMERK